MSKAILKPKATLIWSAQTEKLKKKLSAILDLDLYFEEGKMREMLHSLNDNVGTSRKKLEVFTKL